MVATSSSSGHNRGWHLTGLSAGLVALLVVFFMPGGIVGYLAGITAAFVAVILGHRSVRLPGQLQWAAGVGLGLSYLGLVFSIGLMIVRLTRTFIG